MRVSPNLLRVAALCACASCAACGSAERSAVIRAARASTVLQGRRSGDSPPDNLDAIPDVTPRLEPLSRSANRPYTVLGKDYVPATTLRAYKERGIASWYGRKFHGQKTSNGETYDMYAMSAAHPTLPLPSYARGRMRA
jgi:rare lipoprotein A